MLVSDQCAVLVDGLFPSIDGTAYGFALEAVSRAIESASPSVAELFVSEPNGVCLAGNDASSVASIANNPRLFEGCEERRFPLVLRRSFLFCSFSLCHTGGRWGQSGLSHKWTTTAGVTSYR